MFYNNSPENYTKASNILYDVCKKYEDEDKNSKVEIYKDIFKDYNDIIVLDYDKYENKKDILKNIKKSKYISRYRGGIILYFDEKDENSYVIIYETKF